MSSNVRIAGRKSLGTRDTWRTRATQRFLGAIALKRFRQSALVATERMTTVGGSKMEKPVLILAKVLRDPERKDFDTSKPKRYFLSVLEEVLLYPAVSKQKAEAEFIRLLDS
jgi:hypothetical protein